MESIQNMNYYHIINKLKKTTDKTMKDQLNKELYNRYFGENLGEIRRGKKYPTPTQTISKKIFD